VAAELGRLFSCVKKFSDSGALQAKADVIALSRVCQGIFKTKSNSKTTSFEPFAEARDLIPSTRNDSG
jgi:hypothetical protein